MNELKKFITNTIKSSFFWVKVKNASDITEPIVSALQGKDRKIINPSEISKPIVEAVDRGTKALAEKENKIVNADEIAEPIVEAVGMVDKSVKELGKSNGEERKKDIAELNENFVKMVSVLKTELSKLDSTEKMLAIFEALKKIQSSGDLLKVLGVIEKKIPVVKESKDYTDVLEKIYSGIEKITFDDLANRIDNIKFPAFPETMKVTTDFGKVLRGYAKDGRILVSPDRVGGGSFVDDVKIKNASNELINPAREETLLLVKTACENIKLSADTVNLNTDTLEAKLDTLIAKDYATQTTLAAVLAKIIAAPATAAKQLPDNHQVSVSNPPAEYPLPAAQVSTLTPPAAISGFATEAKQLPDGHEVEVNNFPATQPVSGTAANIGLRKTITAISTTGVAGSTITLTFSDACPSVVANNDTFRITSGSFFVFTSGVLATSFKRFDLGTMSWGSALSITNLAATWGTDGRMVTPGMLGVSYDSGTADADSGTTTLECDGKNWTSDQWIGYQVRITGGTGIGQIRVITDNDTDTLTFASGTDLDATSTFVIEGDENAIYLMGNNTTTTVKYSISGNSWANLSPTANRGGNAVAGMSADFIGVTGDTAWADITNIKDGRYIYSFRGTTSVLDRLNINGGTAGAPTWEVVTYQPSLTTWAAGASTEWDSGTPYIYIAKEGTAAIPQRFYRYNVAGNSVKPIAVDWYLGGAATIGNKIWIKCLSSSKVVKWLYVLQSTSTNLRRLMLF